MNKLIDHTLLKSLATTTDIKKLCKEAVEYKFRGVCVNPKHVELAIEELDEQALVSCVVDFPLGCSLNKLDLAIEAIDLGADELDVVWDLGDFKERKYLKVMNSIHSIVRINPTIRVKVIVESCFLDENEQRKAYQVVQDSGAWCIKTSTRLFDGCSLETIKLWKSLGDLKIKASGGIRTYTGAEMMINAGADIIGTNHGVKIAQTLELPEASTLKDVSIVIEECFTRNGVNVKNVPDPITGIT